MILPKISKRYKQDKKISIETINKLFSYSWSGNVRELENILERAIMLSDGNTILSKDIVIKVEFEKNKNNFKKQIEEFEKTYY